MSGRRDVLSTSLRASALILLAASAVIGVLEIVDALVTSTAVQIPSGSWSALSALTGLLRVAGLAAIGAAATGVIARVHRSLDHRHSTPHQSS